MKNQYNYLDISLENEVTCESLANLQVYICAAPKGV